MAILTIQIPEHLHVGMAVSNALNTAAFAHAGTKNMLAKSNSYRAALPTIEPITNEEMLSFGTISMFGTTISNEIKFKTKSGITFSLADITIDVSIKNAIVSTPLIGVKGMVKEKTGSEDYEIIINGYLWNEKPNAFPIAILKDFIKCIEDEGSIEISSKQLDAFGIRRIALKEYKVPQNEMTLINRQKFILTFLSDIDIVLEFN